MKKLFFFCLITVCFLNACQQKPATSPVDPEVAKAQITELMDTHNTALNGNDAATAASFLSDDAIFMGTDPTEIWDKKTISDVWTQAFADTSFAYNFTIEKRDIKLAKDGKSAIVSEQYFIPLISEKMQIRAIYNLVKTDDGWICDFVSGAFIPKNEDIPALNKALE